jgi:hypothetical protein
MNKNLLETLNLDSQFPQYLMHAMFTTVWVGQWSFVDNITTVSSKSQTRDLWYV